MHSARRTVQQIRFSLFLSGVLLAVYFALALFVPGWTEREAEPYLRAALLMALAVVVVRVVGFLALDVLFRRVKGTEAPRLLHALAAVILYFAAFALILSAVFEQDLSGLAATSAVATVVLGFALQETLGNFFSGISIQIEQPFLIGDTIRIADRLGRVEAFDWRTTSIRTLDNTVVVLPNASVAREPLEVYRAAELNRRLLVLPAPYDVPPERVVALVEDAVRSVPKVAHERPPLVRVKGFADSNVDYEVVYWTRDYLDVEGIDATVRKRVWYLYSRVGIEIPFPHVQLLRPQRQAAPPTQEARASYGADLAANPFFAPLTPEQRAEVADGIEPVVYGPGEPILRAGAPGSSMFIVREGYVEIRLPPPAGDGVRDDRDPPLPVARLGPGDFFGEMALFTGEPRNADAVAVGEVELLEIGKEAVREVVTKNAALAEAFSRLIAERQGGLDARREARASAQGDGAGMPHEGLLHRIRLFFEL